MWPNLCENWTKLSLLLELWGFKVDSYWIWMSQYIEFMDIYLWPILIKANHKSDILHTSIQNMLISFFIWLINSDTKYQKHLKISNETMLICFPNFQTKNKLITWMTINLVSYFNSVSITVCYVHLSTCQKTKQRHRTTMTTSRWIWKWTSLIANMIKVLDNAEKG